MGVFELDTVWGTPELIQSLAAYSYSRLGGVNPDEDDMLQIHDDPASPRGKPDAERQASLLLIRVVAAADYYTDVAELMSNPPPVLVDLILDPFLLNVLPHSLLPTAGYIVAVAVTSLFIARWIATSLQTLADTEAASAEKKQQ